MLLDLPPAISTIVLGDSSTSAHVRRHEQAPPNSWVMSLSGQHDPLSQIAELTLDRLGRMERNWDGYDAIPLGLETTGNAKSALSFIRYSPTPEITPNPNGTVSFEWESERGFSQLEIGRTKASFYLKTKNSDPIFLQTTIMELVGAVALVDQLVCNHLYPLRVYSPTMTQIGFGANGRTAAYCR